MERIYRLDTISLKRFMFINIRRILLSMDMRKMKKIAVWWTCFTGSLLLLNPNNVPLLALFVPFIFLFLALRATLMLTYQSTHLVAEESSAPKKTMAINMLSAVAVSVLAMSSIGQLTVWDFVVLLLASGLGYFYFRRNRSTLT